MAGGWRRAWIIFAPLTVAAGLVALLLGLALWLFSASLPGDGPPPLPGSPAPTPVTTTHATG